jgi:hypothetical protein
MSKDNRDMHQTGWTTPSLPKHLQEARAELSDQALGANEIPSCHGGLENLDVE